jgi:hypothetical protein
MLEFKVFLEQYVFITRSHGSFALLTSATLHCWWPSATLGPPNPRFFIGRTAGQKTDF